ncbi:hypothetical protein ABB02_00098 [Clostridiaceae bacterium JG1575]|nr:hypothetical protein ABB02_00098 [Clostridiaceae bacterium JG1575]
MESNLVKESMKQNKAREIEKQKSDSESTVTRILLMALTLVFFLGAAGTLMLQNRKGAFRPSEFTSFASVLEGKKIQEVSMKNGNRTIATLKNTVDLEQFVSGLKGLEAKKLPAKDFAEMTYKIAYDEAYEVNFYESGTMSLRMIIYPGMKILACKERFYRWKRGKELPWFLIEAMGKKKVLSFGQ